METRSLTPAARIALQRWYERDYAFVEMCRELPPEVRDESA